MVDSAEATRDNSVQPDDAAALAGWREEVQDFLERTLQEIQDAIAELEPRLQEHAPPRPPAATPPRVEPARPRPAGRAEVPNQMDASQTRLENLKRRLSEKLQTHLSDESGKEPRGPSEP
jgi:hypothetical protein